MNGQTTENEGIYALRTSENSGQEDYHSSCDSFSLIHLTNVDLALSHAS